MRVSQFLADLGGGENLYLVVVDTEGLGVGLDEVVLARLPARAHARAMPAQETW